MIFLFPKISLFFPFPISSFIPLYIYFFNSNFLFQHSDYETYEISSGTYPVKPTFDSDGFAIGGNEGVARVVEIGSSVKGFTIGDWVLPSKSGFGKYIFQLFIFFGFVVLIRTNQIICVNLAETNVYSFIIKLLYSLFAIHIPIFSH